MSLRDVVQRSEGRLRVAIAVMVLVGLAGSAVVNVWIEAPAPDALPGVALGSQTLLVAERGVAFFAIWLLVLVVVAQAFKGRLPIEISGRGVRYADADQTQDSITATRQALRRLDEATETLKRDVASLRSDKTDH
jgi:hypothetical protein